MRFQPFEIQTVDGLVTDVSNIQLAATIVAFDVPLHPANAVSTQTGDGLPFPRLTWHFSGASPLGDTAANIGDRWTNEQWIALNPKHPLAICRAAFRWNQSMVDSIFSRQGFQLYHGAAVRITNTRKAAVLAALGHPILGWQWNQDVTTWCFHEAAASDAALYEGEICDLLPTAPISYAKASIFNHEFIVKNLIKGKPQYARVEHKGRTLIIGRDASQQTINKLEKRLYR